MKTNKKYLIMLITLTIIIISSYLIWIFGFKPAYLTQISIFGDMLLLENGVYSFVSANDRLPTSIEEVVKQGFLPSESENYFCPLIHRTFIRKKYSYKHCDYEFQYLTNSLIILIPDSKLRPDYIKIVPVYDRTINIKQPGVSN